MVCPITIRTLIPLEKIARIAHNYRINPFQLDSNQFFALHFCLLEVQMEQEILQRAIDAPLTPERAKYLTYVKTRDIVAAEVAYSEAWLNQTRAQSLQSLEAK